jgi:hypothetical protein
MVHSLTKQNFIRVLAVAFGLSTLSFAAGIAGDLSLADPTSGERVVLRIPPELPTDAVRAAPLPPLVSPADARPAPAPRRSDSTAERRKPARTLVAAGPKIDPDRAPKPDEPMSA